MMKCCINLNGPQEARISQNLISGVYDKIAPVYDIWGKATESKARNRAIELAAIQNGQTVVEVAVGTGLAFYEVVKQNPKGVNIGIDLSEGMLKKANKRLAPLSDSNYTLQQGTAFQLNLANNSVDVLINNYMFDLIPFEDMGKIVEEFKRVLKQDGKLILVNMTEGEKLGSHIYEGIYRAFPKIMGGCRGVKVAELLKAHGFDVHNREYYQQMLFPSEVILAYKKLV